jgi:hypothetical protein
MQRPVPHRNNDGYKPQLMSLLPTTAPALPPADGEALEVLRAELDGHTDTIPAPLVALHLLRVTEGGDFALRRAALDALLRRVKAASDDWRVAGRRHGAGVTAGPHRVIVSHGKSYHVLVSSFGELRGSCDCADFARSSLGLCQHLWWLLARGFDKKGQANAELLPRATLSWDPAELAAPCEGRWFLELF